MRRTAASEPGGWRRLVPGIEQFRGYQRGWLRGDVLAGVTVAAYLIPQVMAYAKIAGLPPVVGLYTAIGPLAVYAVLGSSRRLSVGHGLLRDYPAWELYLGNYTVPAVFFAGTLGMGILFTLLITYPFLERKLSKDTAHHNLLQRPRDAPVRTSLGMMALSFFGVLEASGYNDMIAYQFDISLNAMIWAGCVGLLILPPLVYFVTYRICLGLQRSDREVLEHGIETGIIKRLPHGEFIEVHQPLGPSHDGHPAPLDYQGAPVPKKLNKLGLAGRPVAGSLLRPDPREETDELERARAEQHQGEG